MENYVQNLEFSGIIINQTYGSVTIVDVHFLSQRGGYKCKFSYDISTNQFIFTFFWIIFEILFFFSF
ncbi:hypothetical protein HanRHA438_Chr08g0367621 [Helianthus annuus]|nr:hypothetical protein HanRHA438_Chr08g0367621 [Helianthus annuus]